MLLFVFPTVGISSKRFRRMKSFKSFLRNDIPSRRKIHERIQHDGTRQMLICGSGPCGGADIDRKLVREIGWGFGSGSLSKNGGLPYADGAKGS
jgi:hypothetical protein